MEDEEEVERERRRKVRGSSSATDPDGDDVGVSPGDGPVLDRPAEAPAIPETSQVLSR